MLLGIPKKEGIKVMSKRLTAMFCCLLVITLPFSLAAELDMEEFEEQEVGESIIVYVKAYEPSVLRTSLIEDSDVDVYAFLGGYTLGSALSAIGKFEQQRHEPLYGDPKIKDVDLTPLNKDTEELIRNLGYQKPPQLTLNDLGTYRITLKQIPAEKEVPDEITLDLEAEITFENAERLFSLTQQDLIVPEDKNEETWKEKNAEEYSFFSGRGFIRATNIKDDEASFVIYETQGYREQPSGVISSIASAITQWLQTRTVDLKVGETSGYLRFSEMDFVPENAFRIKLNSIKDPSLAKARVRVSVDGKIQNLVLYEGMPLFSGSSYKVAKIETKDVSGGKKREEITIQGPKGSYTATKTYSPKEQTVLLTAVYDGKNEVITPFKISDIQNVMNKYFKEAKFSTPQTSDLTTEFEIKKVIKKGMTLARVLEAILPREYTYTEEGGTVKIITAKEAEAKDTCEGRVTVLTTEKDVTDGAMENIICTAINEYKELITDHGNEISEEGMPYRDLANYRIGKLYWNLYNIMPEEDQLAAAETAISYLEKAAAQPLIRSDTDAQEILSDLKERLELSAEHKPIVCEDNGRAVTVLLKETVPTPPEEMPHAVIEIEGEGKKTADIGDNIAHSNKYGYAWKVKNMNANEVTLEKIATTNKAIPAETETLRIQRPREIPVGDTKKAFTLHEVQLHKQAYISIIPGTGRPLVSKTNFTLHIPIEERLIKLSPQNIDDQLNQTQHLIDELNKITSRLESVVKTWNTVCLATFAWLTVKNSFFLGFSRSQARKDVLYGVDGESGWKKYCSSQTDVSYDECMRQNEGTIEKQIDETQAAKNQLDDEMDDYKNQQWYKELTAGYKKLDKYGNYLGEHEFFTYDELKKYRYQQLLKQTSSYSALTGDETYNLKEEIEGNMISFEDEKSKKQIAYNQAAEAMAKYPELDAAKEQQAFNDIYRQKLQEAEAGTLTSGEFTLLNEKTVQIVPLLRKEAGTAYINTDEGKKELQQATARHYLEKLGSELAKAAGDADYSKKIQDEMDRINKKYTETKNLGAPLTSTLGTIYVDTKTGRLYASTATYDLGKLNTQYKTRKIIPYPDGKPYCVPTGEGNFVKVLSFFADGSPNLVQEWNVGPDGLMSTGDDIPVMHETLLNLPEYHSKQTRLRSDAARIGARSEGEVVVLNGEEFVVDSPAGARAGMQAGEPSCYDVMDPDDCSTLFGVCDPVMCPASRFNLGGTYQVDNVVQSGIIGSLVLGLHNFNPKEPVPICLTGILAGLKNIESILRGYVQCLKEAQATGKSVGICDQLRSIFICDIIYREIVSLFNAKGGILTWMAKKIFGEGGGEYLNFQNSLQNVQKSVSFFTQEYSRTAFAAYRGRTTEEVGKTICAVAIYGKLPKLGEVMDQLTEPESPPQFMAKLQVTPHSEFARERLEAYNIFYHIYAGEDREADYSLFLRNRLGTAYYATEKCEGRSATIPAGGIASHSLDCVTDAGYDEICVTINGVTQCGFGKVTSTFSLNYLNDLIVEDEAAKQITTEEDCIPDNQRYTAPAYELIPGATTIGSSGIIRVCSMQNPGQGTTPEKWKVIGTCGKDPEGRSLGSCWIDLRTVTIRDTERMERTQKALQEAGLNETKTKLGFTYLLDAETAKAKLTELNKRPRATVALMLDLLQEYKSLEESSLSLAVAAEAKYKAAQLYEALSDHAVLPLLAIPGAAVTEAVKKAAKEPRELTEKEKETIERECMKCEAGTGWCSLKECHGIGSSCVSTLEGPLVPWWAGPLYFIDDTECHACALATSCDYFSNDKTQCKRKECTQQAGLECEWGELVGEEKCISKETAEAGLEFESGNIVPIPKNLANVKCEAGNNCKLEKETLEALMAVAEKLEEDEVLRITSAYRTPEQQRALFIKYLTYTQNPAAQKTSPACPSELAKKEGITPSSPEVQDLGTYKNCPHVEGTAIDAYLCKVYEPGTPLGKRHEDDKCGPLSGLENSKRLQELMCKENWVSWKPERWHYEYGSSVWWKATKRESPKQCIYGSGTREHVVSPVE